MRRRTRLPSGASALHDARQAVEPVLGRLQRDADLPRVDGDADAPKAGWLRARCRRRPASPRRRRPRGRQQVAAGEGGHEGVGRMGDAAARPSPPAQAPVDQHPEPASVAASRKSWVDDERRQRQVGEDVLSSPRTTAGCGRPAPTAARRAARPAGSRASARATATRWRSPPDSAPGSLVGEVADAQALEQRGHVGVPAAAEGDVAAHRHVREQRVLLEDQADRALLGGRSIFAAASNHARSPRATRPRSGRRSPAMARRTVDLPAPEGPTSATVSAPMLRRRPSSNERRATAKSSSSVSTRRASCTGQQHSAAEHDEQHADGQGDVEIASSCS